MANDAKCVVSDDAIVFEMLRTRITGDWRDADTKGAAVIEFAARGCKNFAENEVNDLVHLAMRMEGTDANADE